MVGKPRRNPVTDEQILASYAVTHSAQQTAKALGIGATTTHRVLVKNGVARPGLQEWRSKATKFKGQEAEIAEAYLSGVNYAGLRKKFGDASDYAFKHALRRHGVTLRENPAPPVQDGEIEAIRTMNAQGIGQVAISIALGRSQSFVGRLMQKHGIAPLYRKGPEHHLWKGGRHIDSSGYVRTLVAPDDPMRAMALNTGHVLEHRLIMARKLGRLLTKTETVHHIDGDRTNNSPENLELRQGKHGKHVIMCCLDCGSRNVGHAKIGRD